jgi:hypothetical protein
VNISILQFNLNYDFLDPQRITVAGNCEMEKHTLDAPRSLFQVHNPNDSYCLARAIAVGLAWYRDIAPLENRQPPYSLSFMQAWHDVGRLQSTMALRIMQNAQLTMDKPAYDLADVDCIQRWFDSVEGSGYYRIIVFHKEQLFKVAYKGAAAPAQKEIYLVLANGHYSFISEPHQLFQVS